MKKSVHLTPHFPPNTVLFLCPPKGKKSSKNCPYFLILIPLFVFSIESRKSFYNLHFISLSLILVRVTNNLCILKSKSQHQYSSSWSVVFDGQSLLPLWNASFPRYILGFPPASLVIFSTSLLSTGSSLFFWPAMNALRLCLLTFLYQYSPLL